MKTACETLMTDEHGGAAVARRVAGHKVDAFPRVGVVLCFPSTPQEDALR